MGGWDPRWQVPQRWEGMQISMLKTGASNSLCDLRQFLPCPARPQFPCLKHERGDPFCLDFFSQGASPTPHLYPTLSLRVRKRAGSWLRELHPHLPARLLRISSLRTHHPLGELIKLSFPNYKPVSSSGSEVKESLSHSGSRTSTDCREMGT